MVVTPNQQMWHHLLSRVQVAASNDEEWRENDEHGEFTVKFYPAYGRCHYDKDNHIVHICRYNGGHLESVVYHELIHRAQFFAPELKQDWQDYKGGLYGIAKNANPKDYFGSKLEQMAYAGGDVEWHRLVCKDSKNSLRLNSRNRDWFNLPYPVAGECAIPPDYDHTPYEEAYFKYVSEYIELLEDEKPTTPAQVPTG